MFCSLVDRLMETEKAVSLRLFIPHSWSMPLATLTIDRCLECGHTAETEPQRIWNICTSIFCLLRTLDENLLDVIKIVVCIESRAICLLQS